MGEIIKFPNESEFDFESFVEAYRACVAKFGEPMRLYVPNDKRMHELFRTAEIMQEIADDDGDLEFECGIDDEYKDIGYVELRGYLMMISKFDGDLYPKLQEAIDLADCVDIGLTSDEKFYFELTFHDVMTMKYQS